MPVRKKASSLEGVGTSRSVDHRPPWGSEATADAKAGANADAKVSSDLQDAWRLAYVVVADGDLATKAVSNAFVGSETHERPSRVELLESTLRISLTRAADGSDTVTDSAVTMALWQLPAQQRAALWLTTVTDLDNSTLGAVLGITPSKAGDIAERAVEWLDVALDHESGPLCEWETELADFTEHKLPPEEEKELEEHLPDCPTCRTKLRARDELSDLKAVLARAVPTAPPWLTIDTLGREERSQESNGDATLSAVKGRTPAVRPLAACCAALVVVAVIGIAIMRSSHNAKPVSTNDPATLLPSLSGSAVTDGVIGSSSEVPVTTATTIPVTTSSLPTLTFPTIPGRKSKR